MNLDPRTLYANALSALLKGEMAKVAINRDFVLLREIAKLAHGDAPVEFAPTDPALFASWRAAVTRYHLCGWTNMTPARVTEVAALASSRAPGVDDAFFDPLPDAELNAWEGR